MFARENEFYYSFAHHFSIIMVVQWIIPTIQEIQSHIFYELPTGARVSIYIYVFLSRCSTLVTVIRRAAEGQMNWLIADDTSVM